MALNSKFRITSENGLHARPAAELSRIASQFPCSVKMITEHKKVEVKSIMGLLALAATRGTLFELVIDGDQEEDALKGLTQYLLSDLAEAVDV